MKIKKACPVLFTIAMILAACQSKPALVTYDESIQPTLTVTPSAATTMTEEVRSTAVIEHKIDLWKSSTPMLRGVNIWQSLVIPEVDDTSKGSGRVGPPFTQQDFDLLAALGANYVVISAPGLFTETPPYRVDEEVQRNLDSMLGMIAKADLFATIAFRTGPGKAEWSLCCSDTHYYDNYFNDTVWSDTEAQAAWLTMWQYTAERYRDNPVVVGYELMVEPNAADILYGIDSPKEFFRSYAGTLADWTAFYPKIVNAIRTVDAETPILIGADGYSSVEWLSSLPTVDAENIVYDVHQYMPFDTYTHQGTRGKNSYPGEFDIDEDDEIEQFNQQYISNLLQPVRQYQKRNHVSVVINEFGVKRWVPGAAAYLNDLLAIFENEGWNYAIWEWSTSYEPFGPDVDDFNYKFGTDPTNKTILLSNPLLNVLKSYWSLNTVRPSTVSW